MSPISTAVRPIRLVIPCALLLLGGALAAAAEPDVLNDQQHFAREIYQELVQINTTASVGDTYQAAQAMAARLKAAGFPDEDIHVFETAPKRGDLVARLRGNGKRKPILLMAHIDVVEAKREDWSTDPFAATPPAMASAGSSTIIGISSMRSSRSTRAVA